MAILFPATLMGLYMSSAGWILLYEAVLNLGSLFCVSFLKVLNLFHVHAGNFNGLIV